MSDLANAVARLARAVARLEAAARQPHKANDEHLAATATEIAGRVDAALKKLDRLLETEAG